MQDSISSSSFSHSLFSKCETSREIAALALLCVAEAITYTALDNESSNSTESWLSLCALKSGFQSADHLKSVFSRNIISELLVLSRGSSSSKWPEQIHKLIKTTHNVYVQDIYECKRTPSDVKDAIRGSHSRYKCQICGTKEHSSQYEELDYQAVRQTLFDRWC